MIRRGPRDLTLLVMLGLLGCGPADVSNCSVRKTPRGAYVATVTLHNHSSASIVKSTFVIDASHLGPNGGHRVFETLAIVGAGETRTFDATNDGAANDWSFKTDAGARGGCELDHVDFSDGTNWELPSPL